MKYQCNPVYKYVAQLLILYIIIKYVMNLDMADDKLKGIAIVGVIVAFIIDTVTIEDHLKYFFDSEKEVEIRKTIKPIVINNEIREDFITDDEKSFIVNDIKSIKSDFFDGVSVTEKVDNGIPLQAFERLSTNKSSSPYVEL